jgi:hypothetical protein
MFALQVNRNYARNGNLSYLSRFFANYLSTRGEKSIN